MGAGCPKGWRGSMGVGKVISSQTLKGKEVALVGFCPRCLFAAISNRTHVSTPLSVGDT